MTSHRRIVTATAVLLTGALTIATEHAGGAVTQSPSASVRWSSEFGSTVDELPADLATSSSGDTYVVFQAAGNFGGFTVVGGDDAYLVKYDKFGNQVWVRRVASAGDEQPIAVAVASNSDVYIAGTTTGSLTGEADPAGDSDAFVARFTKSGTQKWVHQIGTTASDVLTGLAVSKSDIYLALTTQGDLGGPADVHSDVAVIRLDSAGQIKWTRRLGSPTVDSGSRIAATASAVYVSGTTYGAVQPSAAVDPDGELFVAKISRAGVQDWVTQFGTTSAELAVDIAVSKQGFTYLAATTDGVFPGAAGFGSYDGVIARLDTTGELLGVTQFGTSAADAVFGLAVNKAGTRVVASGSTTGSFEGIPGLGSLDGFVITFDQGADPLSIRLIGTNVGDDAGSGPAFLPSGDVVVGGTTIGTFTGLRRTGGSDQWLMALPPE